MARAALIASLLLLAAQASAQVADPVARARAVLERADYQTELPGVERAAADGDADGDAIGAEHWPVALPAATGVVATGFAWVLLGALIVAVVAGVAQMSVVRLRRRTDGSQDPEAVASRANASSTPTAARARPLEELLEQRAWSLAVHTLLERALAHIEARSRKHLPISATSRELLGHAAVGEGRRHLAILVAAVERSRFGGTRLGEADYQRSRQAFDALATGTPGPT